MTSTSVKDVSTVMKSFVSNTGSSVGNNAKTSFQEVWNSQTGKNEASDTSANDNKKVSGDVDSAQRGESLRAREVTNTQQKQEPVEENRPVEAVDDQKLEEAMEVLGTAATELMQEIAATFEMPVEELEQLMAEMNMEPVDVLNPDKLSALLLEAGGATDSLALLTDEGLCNNFQTLMNQQKELLAQVSEKLQMTPEQLTQLVDEMDSFRADAEGVLMTPNAEVVEETTPQIVVEVDETQVQQTDANGKSAEVLTESGVAAEKTVVDTEENPTNQTNSDGGNEQHTDNAKEQPGNLLLQNVKTDNFTSELQQLGESTSVWNENTENIMRQIMDYMKIQVKADTSSLEMQLHPASLGTLQVQVASKGGVLTANFITENEAVKAALESQMVQLKESFAEQGVKVEAIEVTVQTHQFESNLEQGRGRQQEEMTRKGRPRRINLNASLGMEDMADMTEEEMLAADMMTANGNTVDYTA
ncbi:MAG: flagellar hook-length control protein FliK [Lachnospiraceae bacterium]|nr:flagellar hook-length control protein FliK [Lachnospiraceae bacterium]